MQAREEAHGRLADLLAGRVAQRDDEVARAERGHAARAEPAAAHDAREQLEPAQGGVLALAVGQRAQRVEADRRAADVGAARQAEQYLGRVLSGAHVGRAGARDELRREDVQRGA